MGAVEIVQQQCVGVASRPDVAAAHASGFFDICIEVLTAFAARGKSGLADTKHQVVFQALTALHYAREHPGAEEKTRGIAPALSFCLEPAHSLDWIEAIGALFYLFYC